MTLCWRRSPGTRWWTWEPIRTPSGSTIRRRPRQIGEAVLGGDAERGVFVCGSGVGASIAASKLPGIRAAICHDVYSAHQGVEHDDMNVLCLGSEVVGPSLARDLVTTFLAARFDGGERYVKRLQMIEDIERNAAHA